MEINIQKFNEVANAAKAKTDNKRWQNAIDAAVAGVVSGWWVISELHDGIAVTTECGKTYFANGSCQCRAFELGQPCKHRALARLIDLYNETAPAAVSSLAAFARCEDTDPDWSDPAVQERWNAFAAPEASFVADVAASSRKNLIAEIQNVWPKTWPPLAVELMARFRCNKLEFLDDDQLRRVRMAIAM